MGLFDGAFDGAFGGAIGAVGSLIGGGINASNASAQMAMQKEFAQNGVRWKVEDAKRAGIHPLAALGAQTFSYNPVMVGDNGVSEAMARMGQGITRAQEAKALDEERQANSVVRNLQIEGLKLDNQRKAQQIKNDEVEQAYRLADRVAATQQQVPPMPAVNEKMPGGLPPTPSHTGDIKPFWEHYRNFRWITPVPAGDLKDYVSENQLINLASQFSYADAAWSGRVRPDDSMHTPGERARIQAGLSTSRYYPLFGWRIEPAVGHYLTRLAPFMRPAVWDALVRALKRK